MSLFKILIFLFLFYITTKIIKTYIFIKKIKTAHTFEDKQKKSTRSSDIEAEYKVLKD